MKVKGIAVKSIKEYIKENYPEKYDEWIEAMPEASKKIHQDLIYASKLYSVIDAVLKPTETAAILFDKGDAEKMAYNMGKYSGMKALKSIYKIFVKITSLDFVLKRITSMYSTYYDSGAVKLTHRDDKTAKFLILGLNEAEKLNLVRIAGWADALFSVIAKVPTKVTHSIIGTNGDEIEGEIVVSWE